MEGARGGGVLKISYDFPDVDWQLVFRMQFAFCNSRLNSQLHSRMQFAIQKFFQCFCIPKELKHSGWGSGDKLSPM